jgi:polar amino acid transport system permease protein
MSMSETTERARPEPIKAVPVRHPMRWVGAAVLAVLAAMFIHLLVTNTAFNWSFMVNNMFRPPIIAGVRTTLSIAALAMALGVVLGVVIAVLRLSPSPILSKPAWVYTWFFRAIPRLVLCILFGDLGILWHRLEIGIPFDRQLGALVGIHDFQARIWGVDARTFLSGFAAGVLALGLSEAAYMAEIVRAGIQSIDPGQSEAAEALGLNRPQTLRRIVLPQAMRVIVPPTGNEAIAMLKDTSLVSAVPVTSELFYQLQAVGNRNFQIVPMLVAACIWYLIMVSVLMLIQFYVERYFSRGFGPTARARMRVRDLGAQQNGMVAIPPEQGDGA